MVATITCIETREYGAITWENRLGRPRSMNGTAKDIRHTKAEAT